MTDAPQIFLPHPAQKALLEAIGRGRDKPGFRLLIIKTQRIFHNTESQRMYLNALRGNSG